MGGLGPLMNGPAISAIDGWAGPIDEWAVLTYGSEHIYVVGNTRWGRHLQSSG